MEEPSKPAPEAEETDDRAKEAKARQKLARPPKDKTEVTIGPTDRSGPDVVIG
jgi:hypothetical protein